MRWLCFQLHAPLAAFGSEAIDAHGVTSDFPAQSMLTGLFANAFGWDRGMRQEHQSLQDRIVYGVFREEEPALGRMTDYQTARINKDDKSWTTRGKPAGRAGGAVTYLGSHQRWRDYHADLRITGVVRLEPVDTAPTLDDLAEALMYPARPLFIGRKSCLPSSPIFKGEDWTFDAPSIGAALELALKKAQLKDTEKLRAYWSTREEESDSDMTTMATDKFQLEINQRKLVTDERNWITGIHGGARRVCAGTITMVGS